MAIEWDEAKNRANRHKHGIEFSAVETFEWETASIEVDRRRDYGELRQMATGYIVGRLYVLAFVRRGNDIRVISLRKANRREALRYEKSH